MDEVRRRPTSSSLRLAGNLDFANLAFLPDEVTLFWDLIQESVVFDAPTSSEVVFVHARVSRQSHCISDTDVVGRRWLTSAVVMTTVDVGRRPTVVVTV
jgi:hypothetical protein